MQKKSARGIIGGIAAGAVFTMTGCALRPQSGASGFNGVTVLSERPDRIISQLDNRLIIITQRMPAAPVVSAQVWVETGSIYEGRYAGSGISHFLEHLLSGGSTSTRTEKEAGAILGRIGAQKNAATGLDSVRYYINTTGNHALTAVDLLSDWMLNSVIPESEFLRERDVIQREFSMGEGEPNRILWRLTQQARYGAHPARHPTIGYIDEFLEVSRDQVTDFYGSMYAPNNMIFVVAGDIDPRAVTEHIADIWHNVPARELPRINFPSEPDLDSPEELSGRADIQRPRIRLAWPAARLGGDHDYALDLLAAILGQGETSRLNRTVRDGSQLVTSVNAYNLSFSWGEGFFGIDAEAAAGDMGPEKAIETSRSALIEQVELLKRENVSERELDRAKRNILSRAMSANQTVQEVAARLAGDLLSTGDPDYLERYAREIQKLTPADLMKAAEKYLDSERLITVTLLPETPENPAGTLQRTAEKEVAADYEPEPVELDNRRLIKKLRHTSDAAAEKTQRGTDGGYHMYELENGLRVIVQRSAAVPAVSMQIYWKGGLLGEEPGKEGFAAAAAVMMTRGAGEYTAEEFAEAVEDLGAAVTVASGYNTDYAKAHALSEDWPRVMELMADAVLRPAFAEDEWGKVQPRLLAAIDRQSDSWYGELSRQFRAAYFGTHPWSLTSLGRRETVEALTAEDLRKFHNGRISAADTVVAVAGDVDPEQVLEKAALLFGGLPRDPVRRAAAPVPEMPDPGLIQFATAKPVTAVTMGFGPAIERAHEDYAQVQVLSNIISDFPAGWLQQALRGEGPGLVYAAWARIVTGMVPGYFELTFNTSPGQAPEAIDRSLRVIRRAKDQPVSREDLQRARAKALFGEFFARQSNSDRAGNAALDELYGIGDPDGRRLRREIEKVTARDIQKAARRHLSRAAVIVISNEPIDEDALTEKIPGAKLPD